MVNELEELGVHEFRIRRSVLYLLFRGAFLWVACLFSLIGMDWALSGLEADTLYLGGIELSAFIKLLTWLHVLLFILYGALSLFVVLHWYYEYYLIRSDAILVHRGIVFSSEQVFQTEDIKSIEIIQGFFGRIFDTGTVKLFAHRAQQHVRMAGVDRPHAVATHVHKLHPVPETIAPIVTKRFRE